MKEEGKLLHKKICLIPFSLEAPSVVSEESLVALLAKLLMTDSIVFL